MSEAGPSGDRRGEDTPGVPQALGFFVDWNGLTRPVAPFDGGVAQIGLRGDRRMVEVVDGEGFVIYEADLHASLDSIRACGASVVLA